jgi:hypothetical protein
MEIIDPFYLYLILQLDSIKTALSFTSFFGIVLGAGFFAGLSHYISTETSYKNRSPHYYDGDDAVATARASRRWAVAVLVVGCVSGIANTLAPTTERMAVLVVAPAIANNKAVQEEAGELYALARRGLTKLIDEEQPPATEESDR